jgi:hexosaminidase
MVMKRLTFFIFFLLISTLATHAQALLNLMPAPRQMDLKAGEYKLTTKFTVAIDADTSDQILFNAANRMYQTLNRRTALYFIQQRIKPLPKDESASMIISVKKKVVPSVGEDESYSLNITAGQVSLTANTTVGAMWGMQTLIQLLSKQDSNYYFPGLEIHDAPRFAWRGLMIDICRHFIPVDIMRRNIEAMESVKMNVLHLHLTDNEGFRFESKVYPALQGKGSNGEYYTQAQIRELIGFAQARGITIIPEFDIPGHTKSWFAGHPELSSSSGPFTAGPPVDFKLNGQMNLASIMQMVQTAPFPTIDPTKESTYTFLDKFFAEVTALFPATFIHIGADENNGVVWKNNPAIQEFMKKNNIADNHALQAYFVERVQQILAKYKKQTIAWEEAFSKDVSNKITLQVWQNPAYLQKALTNGNPVLISLGFYLDLFMPAFIHYNNPVYASLGTQDESKVTGGEAAQWTEIANAQNIETRVWPRAAAIAERLWSPKTVDNVEDMYRRLFVISRQLEESGLQHKAEYVQSLKRLANSDSIATLKCFTDLLDPVKGYKKLFARFTQQESATFQTAPLVEISDIIPVDQQTKWEFRAAVQSWLTHKDGPSAKRIIGWLKEWQQVNTDLRPMFDQSVQLKKVEQHSKNLAILASIGLEAMEKNKMGQIAETWQKEKLEMISGAAKPFGETELSILPEIKALVTGVLDPLPKTYPAF